MIAYYVNDSIHQIPSFIHIARVTNGTVFTHDPDSYAVLRKHYPEVPSELHPTLDSVRARLTELRPEAVVQPEYSRRDLALPFDTVHVQVFHGTSDKVYNLHRKVKEYDLVLLAGERMRETMEKAGLLRPGHYAVVGYPKADRVFRGELPKKAAVRRLGLQTDRSVILYAPTWRDYAGNSSLSKFGAALLSTVPKRYTLIVKLHPNTKRHDRKYYPLIERLAAKKPNVKLLGFEHDVIPVMAAADVLLTDVSTVSHEFLCFDRPLVFLNPRRLFPLGRSKTWVWRTGRVVNRPSEVWQAVDESLAHPGAYAAERKAAREHIFYKPDGHAAERAAEAIRNFVALWKSGEVGLTP